MPQNRNRRRGVERLEKLEKLERADRISSSPPPLSISRPVTTTTSGGSVIVDPNVAQRRSGLDQISLQHASDNKSTTSLREAIADVKLEHTMSRRPNVFEFLQEGDLTDGAPPLENRNMRGLPILMPKGKSSTQISSSRSETGHSNRPLGPRFDTSRDYSLDQSPDQTSSVTSKELFDLQPLTPPDESPNAIQKHIPGIQIAAPTSHMAGTYESPTNSPLGSPVMATGQQLNYPAPETYYFPPRDKPLLRGREMLTMSPTKSTVSAASEKPKTKKHTKPRSLSSGYEFLASSLHTSVDGEKSLPPLYRKFETLNHRVLLHLQDEVAEMEDELHTLDEYEEKHRTSLAHREGTKPAPASRRMDSQMQAFSSLYYSRIQLLEKITHKIAQYNHALSSYNKVLKTLSQASEDDIQLYRKWMRDHSPITKTEAQFLDRDRDLISLNTRTPRGHTAAIYSTIGVISAAILLPLLAFNTIPELAGRLVVVTMVGSAATCFLAFFSSGISQVINPQDGWKCAALYFGFMTIAAMVIL